MPMGWPLEEPSPTTHPFAPSCAIGITGSPLAGFDTGYTSSTQVVSFTPGGFFRATTGNNRSLPELMACPSTPQGGITGSQRTAQRNSSPVAKPPLA